MQVNLSVAQAGVKSAQVTLDRAKQNLSYTNIYAPINGVVVERDVDVGQTVAASLSAPQLFLIAQDLSQMQILAAVDESDIAAIKDSQAVKFTVQSYPGAHLQRRVGAGAAPVEAHRQRGELHRGRHARQRGRQAAARHDGHGRVHHGLGDERAHRSEPGAAVQADGGARGAAAGITTADARARRRRHGGRGAATDSTARRARPARARLRRPPRAGGTGARRRPAEREAPAHSTRSTNQES